MEKKSNGNEFSLFGIYPKYALFIGLYSIIFFTIGSSFAQFLDNIFPKFNYENPEEKSKYQYYFETIVQMACIGIIAYIFREFINYLVNSIDILRRNIYGKPGKFAVIIIAPTMFALQPNLIEKVEYLWN